MQRILCPKHQESTPSCVVYSTHAKCYGCGAIIPLSEIGIATEAPKERYREDLVAAYEYINSLPVKTVRGFSFSADGLGYYLQWPDKSYYKRRNWTQEPKYKNPSGHSQPPFWVRRERHPILTVVEGEINALSIGQAFPEWDIVSPGSASDFKAKKTDNLLLHYCSSYRTIVIMVDKDGAGVEAAIHTKGILIGRVPQIPVLLMSEDANEIYCTHGKEKLRQEVEHTLHKVQAGGN